MTARPGCAAFRGAGSAADVLRRIDPGESPTKIATWLGHYDPRSQEEYAHAGEGRAMSDAWAVEREAIRSAPPG